MSYCLRFPRASFMTNLTGRISAIVLACAAIACDAMQSVDIAERASLSMIRKETSFLNTEEISSARLDGRFEVLAAPSEQSRKGWENIFKQFQALFVQPEADGEVGVTLQEQDFPLRGQGGICTSCKKDGNIFKTVNYTNNEVSGVLGSVRLRSDAKPISDTVYVIDEYRMGGNIPPFRYCGVLCSAWYLPMCIKDKNASIATSRKTLWTRRNFARWDKWILPGSNVIDIGANVGDTTIEMATRAAKTLGFEANPRAAVHAQIHASLNPKLNIKIHPVAVAPEDGNMSLSVDCGGCNSGPVESRRWMGTVIQVPQKRLDTFLLKEHGEDFVKNVSFIKIDTEGFDKTLLRAYKPLLIFGKPTFWVEWFDPYWQQGSREDISPGSHDLFAAIQEIGYIPLNPATMKVVTPESKNGVPDLLLLPAEKALSFL